MAVPNTEDILSMASSRVPEFIRSQAGSRTLSVLVRRLNRELLEGDETVRGRAAAALAHLGFHDPHHP